MAAIPGALFFAWCTLMAVAPLRRPRRLAVISWISSAVAQRAAVPVPVHRHRVRRADRPRRRSRCPRFVDLGRRGRVDVGRSDRRRRAARCAPDRSSSGHWSTAWAHGGGASSIPSSPVGCAGTCRGRGSCSCRGCSGATTSNALANVAYGDDGTSNLLDVYRHRSHPIGRADAHLPARRRVPLGPQEPRGAPAPLPPRQPRLDLHQRQLPPRPARRRLPPQPHRRQEAHRLGPHPRSRLRRRSRHHLPGRRLGRRPPHGDRRAHRQRPNLPTRLRRRRHLDHRRHRPVRLLRPARPTIDDPPTTPLAYDGDAPPFFVIHGDHDTYTPPEGARALVEHLRAVSSNPILYAELPGAQHSFDLFHSVRFETVIDGIEAFAAWVRSQHQPVQQSSHAQASTT